MFKTISYGITKNYLKHWDSSCMLREVFQNFKDFGEYNVSQLSSEDGYVTINVSNDFEPENIDFLFIGESSKGSDDIGGHGEGLKMAGLIAAREGLNFIIRYKREMVVAMFDENGLFKFQLHSLPQSTSDLDSKFEISFSVRTEDWIDFKSRSIKDSEILHSCQYGKIVDKEPGSVYVGGLYVCNLDKFKRAYDFNPTYIKLDRDRSTPSNFDVEYYASKISEKFDEDFTFEDLGKRDFSYVEKIPENKIKEIKVDASDVSSIKLLDPEGNTISNSNVKSYLFRQSYVSDQIKKAKMMVAKKLGIIDMLEDFMERHALTSSAKMDMEIIIKKAKGENE